MEIRYEDIVLRDYRVTDIEDDIRWNTVETEWALWDAPWEMEKELQRFHPENFRKEQMEALQKAKTGFRWSFELDTADGVHIGGVNSYLVDENFEWIKRKDVASGQKVYHTLGIDILESSYWGKGLGTQALAAFIQYHLDHGVRNLCLQTWSGNIRMIKVAEKLGFQVCKCRFGIRKVRGGTYDGLTFHLDVDKFHAYMEENISV